MADRSLQPRFLNQGLVSNQAATQNVYGNVISNTDQDPLNKLPHIEDATFESWSHQHDRMCMDGTRMELLEEIRAWSDDPQGTSIFWLTGMAGTGKSTVARTVARKLGDQKRLGASFFFSRGQGDRGRAVKFFPTLAFELLTSIAALQPILRKATEAEPKLEISGIETKSLRYQWKNLLFHPLKGLNDTKSHQEAIHIVVDALDECESEDDVQAILALITEVQDLENIHVTIFLTSRPEIPVRTGFRNMPRTTYRDLILDEIPRDVVQADIRLYLRKEMDRIRRDFEILEDWPDETAIANLVHQADVLFIYAATVCSFIGDRYDPDGPKELLDLVLSRKTAGTSPFQALDDMYTKVLEHSIAKMKGERSIERLGQNFREVVGAIVVLFDSLSADGLGDLLGIGKTKVRMTLRFLHSVLHIPKDETCAIRLLHPSFHDFLLDGERCRERIFLIDYEDSHLKIAEGCLAIMSKSLRKNICNLKNEWSSAESVEDECLDTALPPQLRYACVHWIGHLQQAGQAREQSNCLENNKQVHIFLKLHFRHWLEVLILLGIEDKAWAMMSALRFLMDYQPYGLSWLVERAQGFTAHMRKTGDVEYIVQPLSIYDSGETFGSPTDDEFDISSMAGDVPRLEHICRHVRGLCWQ